MTAWDKSRISGDFVVQADGLFVESADIDRHVLQEVEPTAPELARAPGLYLCFVPIREPEPYRGSETLKIPVYYSPSRENLLVDISIPITSIDEKNKWILAGVAFFLSSS